MKKKFVLMLIVMLVVAVLLSACGSGEAYSTEMVAEGAELYISNCSSCHGPDAKGLEGKGVDLTNNEFIQSLPDDFDLLNYVFDGRAMDDPLNSTGIEMPPGGGNPAIKSDDVYAIIAYLRGFQGE